MGAAIEMEKLPFVNYYNGSWSRWESLMDNKAGGGKLEGKHEIDGNCEYLPIKFHSYKVKTNLCVFGEGWQRCRTVMQLASAVLGGGRWTSCALKGRTEGSPASGRGSCWGHRAWVCLGGDNGQAWVGSSVLYKSVKDKKMWESVRNSSKKRKLA